METLTLQVYYQLVSTLELFALTMGLYPTRGRKPKVRDAEIAAAFMISYLNHTPVLKFLQMNKDSSIRSWHVFRRTRIARVYKLLRYFMLYCAIARILLQILSCLVYLKRMRKLIVDGSILNVANVYRAKTHRIKRFSGKRFWVKRKKKLYSPHYKQKIEFEEIHYGVLVRFICDTEGFIYDIWFTYGSMHETKALNARVNKSLWCRFLAEGIGFIGDKGYRGNYYVEVCESKELKSIKQMVETLISGTKGFAYSRWRKGITLLTYLYGFALGFSLLRNVNKGLRR